MFWLSPDRADILVMKWRDKGESGTKSPSRKRNSLLLKNLKKA